MVLGSKQHLGQTHADTLLFPVKEKNEQRINNELTMN